MCVCVCVCVPSVSPGRLQLVPCPRQQCGAAAGAAAEPLRAGAGSAEGGGLLQAAGRPRPGLPYQPAQRYACMHTHTHTHTHIGRSACPKVHVHVHGHTHIGRSACPKVHTRTHTHAHPCTHTSAEKPAQRCTRTCMHTHARTRACTRTLTHTHARTHTLPDHHA